MDLVDAVEYLDACAVAAGRLDCSSTRPEDVCASVAEARSTMIDAVGVLLRTDLADPGTDDAPPPSSSRPS